MAVLALIAGLADAQTPSGGQRPAPGADQGITTSDIGGGRTLDMLIDMAAAASAPLGAEARTKAMAGTWTGGGSAKDSREVLLQDLKRSDPVRAAGSTETGKSESLPVNLAAPERLVEQVASPVTRDSREQEQTIEVRPTSTESASPARTSSTPRASIDEDSWIRSVVRYLRENRGWIAATAASILVVVGVMTLLFKRAAQPNAHVPAQARSSAGSQNGQPSGTKTASGGVSPRPTRRHRSLRRH